MKTMSKDQKLKLVFGKQGVRKNGIYINELGRRILNVLNFGVYKENEKVFTNFKYNKHSFVKIDDELVDVISFSVKKTNEILNGEATFYFNGKKTKHDCTFIIKNNSNDVIKSETLFAIRPIPKNIFDLDSFFDGDEDDENTNEIAAESFDFLMDSFVSYIDNSYRFVNDDGKQINLRPKQSRYKPLIDMYVFAISNRTSNYEIGHRGIGIGTGDAQLLEDWRKVPPFSNRIPDEVRIKDDFSIEFRFHDHDGTNFVNLCLITDKQYEEFFETDKFHKMSFFEKADFLSKRNKLSMIPKLANE